MKHVILFAAILVGSLTVHANSKKLYIAGTVPYRGDVAVRTSIEGRLSIQQNSPDKLKIETIHRGPASIITVSAP